MANTYNMVVEQGATYTLSITYKDPTGNAIDLTAYTARMMVRSSHAAPSPILTLTTENGAIELGDANGTINLTIDAANTANLPATNSVYDLELDNGSAVTRLIEGVFQVKPEVTR